jgi:lysophospholipase L1-like esterase
MKAKSVIKESCKGLAAVVVFFAMAEVLVRGAYFTRSLIVAPVPLPYGVLGPGPLPPWLEGDRILAVDDTMLWKNQPLRRERYINVFNAVDKDEDRTSFLRQFFPALPKSLKQSKVWDVSINSDGFRDAEYPKTKAPGVLRIVSLGDSWTFGAGVTHDETYPERMRVLLSQEFPQTNFQVFNLGVVGFSSFQGLEMLRRTLHFEPDVVMIAFGMNDSRVGGGAPDSEKAKYNTSAASVRKMQSIVNTSETYKLFRFIADMTKYKPDRFDSQLRGITEASINGDEIWWQRRAKETADYSKYERYTRVPPADYEKNINEMIRRARSAGAEPILLYNELWNTPYRTILQNISAAQTVPLVDSYSLIVAEQRRMENELERKFHLSPGIQTQEAVDNEVNVVFRVYTGSHVSSSKNVYIVGSHKQLGDLVPNKIRMYDDGTNGDQRAEDQVWSYSAKFPSGTRLFYVYTNGGREGEWEGLDVPEIRDFTVETTNGENTVYRPIETFGEIYMQSDIWHTDAAGYEIIAKALVDVLKKTETVRTYLTSRATAGK